MEIGDWEVGGRVRVEDLLERQPQEKSAEERAVMVEALRRVLAEAPEVVFAYLFGSFQKGLPFRDVDVGVYLAEGVDPWETAFRLAAALERALRAVGHPAPVDVRVLNQAPVGFRYHV
ncbi:nucleotidyltransferase domain-containing protein [Candidatus Parcubacteria bacterium]|nr:MAG: nucleotidyltransferase domain-containing protein [Candidatus Parcubacteria bacterium]